MKLPDLESVKDSTSNGGMFIKGVHSPINDHPILSMGVHIPIDDCSILSMVVHSPIDDHPISFMVVHSPINGSPLMSMGCPCLITQKSVLSIVLSSLINDFLGIYVHFSLMSSTASGGVSSVEVNHNMGCKSSLDHHTLKVSET